VDGTRILVVGQGGREHAIVRALHDSPEHPRLYVAPGSAGMEDVAERVPLAGSDAAGIAAWSRRNSIDLVVIGPEAPLQLGLADQLRASGIATVGPGSLGAKLETSKRYAKELLSRLGLPTARFRVAESPEAAEAALSEFDLPVVIKADGLAAGKGVVIATTRDEALATIDVWMRRRVLGDAGAALILEECLTGEEASLLALTDGERWVLFPPARITSGSATVTPDRTPAAWASSRRRARRPARRPPRSRAA